MPARVPPVPMRVWKWRCNDHSWVLEMWWFGSFPGSAQCLDMLDSDDLQGWARGGRKREEAAEESYVG